MQPFGVILLYSTSVMDDHNDRQCTTRTSWSQDSAVPACFFLEQFVAKEKDPALSRLLLCISR